MYKNISYKTFVSCIFLIFKFLKFTLLFCLSLIKDGMFCRLHDVLYSNFDTIGHQKKLIATF